MNTSLRRFFSVGTALTFLMISLSTGPATSATKNAHGRIFSVKATGGLNTATVKWNVEYYHYSVLAYSFFVAVYPQGHPFKTEIQTVSCVRSPCQFYIPTPKKNMIARPIPLKYYFVVTASIPSGRFSSNRSASVSVKFQSNTTPTPISSKTTSLTPSPTPTPSVASVSDYDGKYVGTLVVAFTPAAIATTTVPVTFQILNGMGNGGGGGWTGSGYVADAAGNALVTVSHSLYGTFTIPVTFRIIEASHSKSGVGSGTRSLTIPGVGETTIDFTFTVSG